MITIDPAGLDSHDADDLEEAKQLFKGEVCCLLIAALDDIAVTVYIGKQNCNVFCFPRPNL